MVEPDLPVVAELDQPALVHGRPAVLRVSSQVVIIVALTVTLANTLWAWSSRPAHRAFASALARTEDAQSEYLARLLERNATTEYGSRFGFSGIRDPNDFRRRVPVTEYDDYAAHIERIAEGHPGVLTAEDVLLFEPTSGTTSGTKLIPYTATLRDEFQRAIAPWVASLFADKPGLRSARSYWSISPVGTLPERVGTMRVGFDEDAEYLSRLGRWAMGRVSAVPPSVAGERDVDSFRRRTLAHLLLARDLGLISVWNPTFLTLLLDYFLEHPDDVLREVAASDRTRAREIDRVVSARPGRDVFSRAWPSLEVVSCWTDGPCRPYADAILDYLPQVEIQGKGLLSTEAFVSFPYLRGHDPVLAVTSHFFEFEESAGGETLLAHEVEEGSAYSVIVTTGGGLYRYRLHDRVLVTGRIDEAPTMRFIGKDNVVVDLFGEKLSLSHVSRCLDALFGRRCLAPSFALLAPDASVAAPTCYTLYLECAELDAARAGGVADELDSLLRENFHYDYCRRLGQLGPVKLFLLDGASGAPSAAYTAAIAGRGARLGDVKPSVLDGETGWSERLSGAYVENRSEVAG